jgi:hypothetical protein
MEHRTALWVAICLSILAMLGCGNSKLTLVSLSPNVADALNFPSGAVRGHRHLEQFIQGRAADER